jgi:hypothetical protein
MTKPRITILDDDANIKTRGSAHVQDIGNLVYLHFEDENHIDYATSDLTPKEAVKLAHWLLQVAWKITEGTV